MRAGGYEPTGFFVTQICLKDEKIEGLSVEEFGAVKDITDIGIIITVGKQAMDEVEQLVISRNVEKYIKYLE